VTRRRGGAAAVSTVAALLVAGRLGAGMYVDYQWYAALGDGATAVWSARTINLAILSGVSVVTIALFVLANLYAVRRSIIKVVLPRRMGDLEIGEEIPARYLNATVLVGALTVGLLLGLPQQAWTALALSRHGIPFAERDTSFQNDLGFYVYHIPLEGAIYIRAVTALLVVIGIVVCLYFLFTPGLRWERTGLRMSPYVRRHLAVLTFAVFLAAAWSYRLEMYDMLSHGSGPTGAFTYVDDKVTVPLNLVMSIVSAAAGFVTLLVLWRGQGGGRTALGIATVVIVAHVAAFRVAPALADRMAPARDPVVRARYVAIRSLFTRRAFGAGEGDLGPPNPAAALASAADVARDVPVWDAAALTMAVERGGGRRITGVDSGVSWTMSPAGPVATVIARLSPTPGGVERAIATRLSGVATDARGGVVRVDTLGRPDQQDAPLPPVLIRPGASTPLVVPDSDGRIAAPGMSEFISRLAHAWSAQNLRLLGSDLPEPDPRIVTVRDVRDRVDALAPYFAQGTAVWPAVANDSLYWVVDLYAASDDYPLSQHLSLAGGERSYFRHAATAFVHAATGRVLLVRDDVLDPLAKTWIEQFPALYVSWSSVPAALAALAPPRVDGALATALAYGRETNAPLDSAAPARAVVIDSIADAPDSALDDRSAACVALPQLHTSCAWSVPLRDIDERVAGLIVATGGPTPTILLYRTQRPGRPWMSVVERLEHPSDTAGAPSLGARLVRGHVRAVPANGGVTFVQPEYAWAPDVPPTLVRVTVVGDSVGTGRTIADAEGLAAPVLSRSNVGQLAPNDVRRRVAELYDAMRAALKRGDLATFGVEFDKLGALIGR
jgi:uncharacterized protein